MAWGNRDEGPLSAGQAFGRLTIERLRPLAALLVEDPPKKKGDLVDLVTGAMTDPARVRRLYEQLEPLAALAVREAAHDPQGRYSKTQFVARHAREPEWHEPDAKPDRGSYGRPKTAPRPVSLFFADGKMLPTEVRAILLEFVPPPEPFRIPTSAEPPSEHTFHQYDWKGKPRPGSEETFQVLVRETARDAEADLSAVLRLIDAGKVRVTDKKRVPTEASRRAVTEVLTGGDFYTPDDANEYDNDPAHDLGIKSFAWPMLVQAAGLAEKKGDALKLTPAGRAALTAAPAGVLKKMWAAWLKTKLLDEFARVEAIKGQGRAGLSATADRRKAVLRLLADCPPGEWFTPDDFFRLTRATGRSFELARSPWELYVTDPEYGSLGYDSQHSWEQLQGRYVLAFLFEYAATLGLVDVAYVSPQGVRSDYEDRWGTDDLSCLSRYDGLLYLRINPLGAWSLGLTDTYQSVTPKPTGALRILANLDVVATHPPTPADKLTLDRFADPASAGVWKLSAAKVLSVVEKGGRIDELGEFLAARAADGLPATVATFLADVRRKAATLADGGPARLIACADEHVAAELTNDRQLKGKCLPAGGQMVAVREADLAAVRKAVRRLGYVWPIPGD